MLLTDIKEFKDATVKVWSYKCGCKAGVENSELARNERFFDPCEGHKAASPDPRESIGVEYFLYHMLPSNRQMEIHEGQSIRAEG